MEENNMQIEKLDKIKITRFRFSIAQKVELLDLVKKGTPRTEICRTYNIPTSTLHQFCKDEARIRDEFEKNRDPNRQMIRNSPYHELEKALMQWIGAVQERNIPINGPIVQEKALEFAECMGVKDFSASGGWLDRFKKRENIDFKTPTKISNKPKVAKPLVPAPRTAVSVPHIKDFLPTSTSADSDGSAPIPADVEFSPDPSLHGFDHPFSASFSGKISSGVRGLEKSIVDLELDHIRRMSALLKHYKLLLIVEGEEDGLQAGGDIDLQCKLFGSEAAADEDDDEPSIKSEIPYEEDMGDYFDGGAWNSSSLFTGTSAGQANASPAAYSSVLPPLVGSKRRKSTLSRDEPQTQKKRKRKTKKPSKTTLNSSAARQSVADAKSTSVASLRDDGLVKNGLKARLWQEEEEEEVSHSFKENCDERLRNQRQEAEDDDETQLTNKTRSFVCVERLKL